MFAIPLMKLTLISQIHLLKLQKRVPQSGQKKVSEKRRSYISSRITGDWIN